jgi:5,10-methylenetetrahydromethanopterin reductase
LLGTWGRKVAALAGEVAQEVKIGGTANPEVIPLMRERLGNESVGIVAGAVSVVDEDGAAARARARAEAALYFPVVARLDPSLEAPPRLVEDVRRLVDAGDAQGAGALIPDALLDRIAFAGTPEQVVRQAEALFDAGASRVEFGTPHGLTPARGLDLLAERVLPALRG